MSCAIHLYTGPVPKNADLAVSDAFLLAILTFTRNGKSNATFVGTEQSGFQMAHGDMWRDPSPLASGVATFFRCVVVDGSESGDTIMQGTVGIANCDINLSDTKVVSGKPLEIHGFLLKPRFKEDSFNHPIVTDGSN